VAAFIAFAIAQITKCFTYYYTENKWDFTRIVGSGGMPSSHTSMVRAARCHGTFVTQSTSWSFQGLPEKREIRNAPLQMPRASLQHRVSSVSCQQSTLILLLSELRNILIHAGAWLNYSARLHQRHIGTRICCRPDLQHGAYYAAAEPPFAP
jgi:Divergent PAP2 family